MADTTALKDMRWEKLADGKFVELTVTEEASDLKGLQEKGKALESKIASYQKMRDLVESLTTEEVNILRSAIVGFMRIKPPAATLQTQIDRLQKDLDAINTTLEKEKP